MPFWSNEMSSAKCVGISAMWVTFKTISNWDQIIIVNASFTKKWHRGWRTMFEHDWLYWKFNDITKHITWAYCVLRRGNIEWELTEVSHFFTQYLISEIWEQKLVYLKYSSIWFFSVFVRYLDWKLGQNNEIKAYATSRLACYTMSWKSS